MFIKHLSNATSVTTFITVIVIFFLALGPLNETSAQNGQVVWNQVVRMNAEEADSESGSMGLAILRVTADMKLTYKILVEKIDNGDLLTNAHIHYGAPGVNGSPFIFMAAGVQNLGTNITIQLTQEQFNELVHGTQPIYINVHTHDYPGDSIRGQIR